MYQISVEQHFDAAHFLRGYQGKCESLHGHRYKVVVRINAAQLDETGLAYDFAVLKKNVAGVLEKFDHTCLNDVPPFDKQNPSAENIAAVIYHALKPLLDGGKVSLDCIEVWESPQTWVTYRPD